jgi:uncharacterized membrane protein
MERRKYLWLEALLIAAAALGTALNYPHLPARVPIHWGLNGRANGFGPRWILYVLGPGLMAAIAALGNAIPWLSPRQFSVEGFRPTFERIVFMGVCLMAYINFAIVWSVARDGRHDPGQLVIGGICLFFAALGNILGKVRRNFFIGVRTPWTLANERVWNVTHRLAAKVFVGVGLVGMGMAFAGWRRAPVIVLLVGAVIPVVYSLIYYKSLERRGELSAGDAAPCSTSSSGAHTTPTRL